MGRIERIVVAVDGSEDAHGAAEFCVDLADRYNAAVVVVTVRHTPALSKSATTLQTEETADAEILDSAADAAAKLCEAKGIRYTIKATKGSPGHEIIKAAEKHDADLIILGRFGTGRRLPTMGSVAAHVLKHTTEAVLIAGSGGVSR